MPSILEYIVQLKDQFSATSEKVTAAAEKQTGKWQKLGAGATVALGGAAVAVVEFAKKSVEKFSEAQQSQTALEYAFEKFPAMASTNVAALDKLNESIQSKTTFDHDALASGEATLAQFKLTGQQVQDIIPLVADYAAKTGQDIPAASELVGKALLGNAKALKDIGIKYKATGDTATDFKNIQALLNQQVGGFAEQQGKTAAGQAVILKNAFGDLEEKAGGALVPALTKLTGAFIVALTWLTQTPGALQAVGIGLAAITVGLVAAKIATIEWSASLLANPIVWIAAAAVAAIAGIILVVKNWGAVSGWLKNVWSEGLNAIRGFFEGVWTWLKANWPLLLGIITGPIGLAVVEIAKHKDAILGFFEAIPEKLKSALETVGEAIAAPFRAGFAAVAHLWNNTLGKLHVNIPALGLNVSVPTIPGYATGTPSAAPGYAWVGENGPELVRFGGGEQVLTARQSAAAGGTVRLHLDDMRTIARLIGQESADAVYAGAGAVLAGAQRSAANSSTTRGRTY